MKKLSILLLSLMLISTMLMGCSSQKSEEELKAEIRAEMEAEQKLKEAEKEEPKEDSKEEPKEEPKGEPKDEAILLSALMTIEEIKNKLGDDYTFETEIDGGYFEYNSVLHYDGISFTFFHDGKELPANKKPDGIEITSDKYAFNFDFKVGDPALKAFEYGERNLQNVYDQHSDTEIFDWFYYKEKKDSGELVETGLALNWTYDTEEDYSEKSEITEDVKIKAISIFSILD